MSEQTTASDPGASTSVPPTPSTPDPVSPVPTPPQPGAAPATPPVDPAPAPTAPAWLELVPEPQRGANVFQGVQAETPGEAIVALGTQLANAQSMIGDAGVKIPGQDATEEDVTNFRKHYNIPDQPDGYQLPTDGLYEGKALSEAGTGHLKTVAETGRARIQALAHAINATPIQAAKMYRFFVQSTGEDIAAHESTINQNVEQAQRQLQKEWGGAYQQEIGLGEQAMRQFGGDELIQLATQTGMINTAVWRKAWAQIGKTIAQHDIYGSGGNAALVDTRQESIDKIKQLKADPEYGKKTMKGKQLHKEVTALYKQAYPEETPAE